MVLGLPWRRFSIGDNGVNNLSLAGLVTMKRPNKSVRHPMRFHDANLQNEYRGRSPLLLLLLLLWMTCPLTMYRSFCLIVLEKTKKEDMLDECTMKYDNK
jgi:hypothetical protein